MAYRADQVAEIVYHTPFAASFTLERITLAGLPIWLRLVLVKHA